MKVSYDEMARAEILDAARYFSAISPDLAARFAEEIDIGIRRVVEFPKAWPQSFAETRRYLLTDFPYQLIYKIEGEQIRVYALAHLKRKPGYWLDRVR